MLPRHLFLTALIAFPLTGDAAPVQDAAGSFCADLPGRIEGRRVICADIAALDAMLTYNRFGSYNPFGMIFALRRDLVAADTPPKATRAAECAADDGTDKALVPLSPGNVRLRDCKRPRPLVLRANAGNNEDFSLPEEQRHKGDLLVVSVQNLLRDDVPGHSENFCRQGGAPGGTLAAEVRDALSEGPQPAVDRNEAACLENTKTRPPGQADPAEAEWPRTRWLNFAVQGLVAVEMPEDVRALPQFAGVDAAKDLAVCRGLSSIAPGEVATCFYQIDVAAPYFLSSNAAPSGGEGDGGSITHGLFGAVVAEDMGSEWYRSQVSQAAMDRAWHPVEAELETRLATGDHRRAGQVDYEAAVTRPDGSRIPVLNMLMPTQSGAREIVHSDLNAIVALPDGSSFREFSVFFHDELKTFYTSNFEELGKYGQLAGVRDGFAINYGASGMGAMLLANRKGIGPARDCAECLYEEFFLTSWANGDPALLERYPDDPSNVHHSYLNDEVRFRNFHAGPKETHVFHLHAHQWFAGNDANRGAYLDSQTVAPQQGFSYRIYGGGLDHDRDPDADDPWRAPVGSGNRNRTVGDSIFHCHLYPHFAQGMWELWRVHDVFEDGTRKLPDGQAHARLSTGTLAVDKAAPRPPRPGSIDPASGRWIAAIPAADDPAKLAPPGTPIPALVPLPGRPPPMLPTYAAPEGEGEPFRTAEGEAAMPGFPFYIAGMPGHRPPQAPMDLARALRAEGSGGNTVAQGDYLDGGLPRHTVESGADRSLPFALPADTPRAQAVAKALMLGDMTMHLDRATLRLLPYDGTPLERAAMGFHHNGRLWGEDGVPVAVRRSDGTPVTFDGKGGYPAGPAPAEGGRAPLFTVNGAPPKPGSPFADPCGAPDNDATRTDPLAPWSNAFRTDPRVTGFRRYEVSAVQLDLVTNRAGWHDPQARIAVLTAGSDRYKQNNSGLSGALRPISPFVSAREEPFFFRAFSGECIEFRHTNELPKQLELDDFQVRTPTDTIGQHIHLVKFDVTSSDGSGNGWNYEDGTFAPDEIAARICAARTAGQATVSGPRAPGQAQLREEPGLCVQKTDREGRPVTTADGRPLLVPRHDADDPANDRSQIWRLDRSKYPDLFQTTVQRWFADPILSATGEEAGEGDRTLRTVFSHDHFGPSSIQQHGYYTALIVESPRHTVCAPPTPVAEGATDWDSADCRTAATDDTAAPEPGDGVMVGARRVLLERDPGADPLNPDTREYALAVADFAVLYDPRDSDADAEAAMAGGSPQGLAKLACEARHRGSAARLESVCGSELDRIDGVLTDAAEDAIPAWNAAGRPDETRPMARRGPDAVFPEDVTALFDHLRDYRTRAALGGRLARPVAPPARPEAISVDHHDPYLVNYRGEPMPLRLGTRNESKAPHPDCALARMPAPRDAATGAATATGTTAGLDDADADRLLVTGARPCSYAYHRGDEAGELSNVFLSSLHGDPATPLIETYSGERTLIRLIQGAQEVQHMFGIEGFNFRRNLDQPFPRAEQPAPRRLTQWQRCDLLKAAGGGYPGHYRAWFEGRWADLPPQPAAFFDAFGKAAARCTNIEGNVGAQEIGISEHFEFTGVFRQTGNFSLFAAPPAEVAALRDGPAPVDPRDRLRHSTDYLYSFGTQDALWNGAWGMVRVYLDSEAADLTTCMAENPAADPASCRARQISARLAPMPDRGEGGQLAAEDAAEPRQSLAIACDPAAPRARAAVAAVEAQRIFGPDGLAYGPNLHDPDALVLLALEPEGLIERLAAARDDRAMLLSELRRQYRNDPVEPYVLPVRAGECVELTVVNLLGNREDGALSDDFGDARMPPITPLNTTPGAQFVSPASGSRRQVNALDMTAGKTWRHGLRPSSRLALQMPLPVMTAVQTIAAPFGYNATGSLATLRREARFEDADPPQPGRGGHVRRDANIETITFYAGKVATRGFDPAEMANLLTTGSLPAWLRQLGVDPALAALADGFEEGRLRLAGVARTDFDPRAVTIGGREYRIIPDPDIDNPEALPAWQAFMGLDPQQGTALRRLIESAGAAYLAMEHAHWIPYAFGAMPIKSFGDVIGHPAHGLAGAVLVLPCNAQIEGAGDADPCQRADRAGHVSTDDDTSAAPPPPPVRLVKPRATPAGQAVAYAQAVMCEPDDCHAEAPVQARHFVLFYQDGLNLWDRESRIRWTRSDGSPVRQRALRMQPDCFICDDSYDWGDRAVSYHAAPLHDRLRPGLPRGQRLEADSDLNRVQIPRGLPWRLRAAEAALASDGRGPAKATTPMAVLRAREGEEVTISVVHPGGRARQRAFVTIAQDYDDLFPGFGFPHSALLGPGKAVPAALSARAVRGCYLWHDGPAYMVGNGVWGLLDVVPEAQYGNPDVSACRP